MIKKYLKKAIDFTKKRVFIYPVLLSILLGGFGVRLYKIDNPVADWHAWRQADTASVSRFFVEDGIDLLYPRYHDISKIQTGYENLAGFRFVEFPLFNLIHAVLYETFPGVGFDIWGRLVSVLAAVATSYFLFEIGRKQFSVAVGLLSAFFYSFLPFNIYFTRVILPDPLSVALGVGSVYFFINYVTEKKLTQLFVSALIMSLAVLVKPHAIFFGLPIAYLAVKNFGFKEILKNRWLFVAVDIVLVPFLLWRVWMYQEGLIRGIAHWEWAFNGNGIRFRPSFWRWLFGERTGRLILGFWGILPFGVGALMGRKLTIIHAFLVGAFLYLSIFASANVMHDYYQVFIVPAIVLPLALGTKEIWVNKLFHPVSAKLGLVALIGLMFGLSFYDIRGNFRINDTGILEAGKVANEILPKDAQVIAPYNGDTTFLYQTGRSGWPAVTTSIEKMIELGADYYISVNLGDLDTTNLSSRFEEVRRTDKFVILDLHKKL
ncbi:hypothetical protein A2803_03765 [Candidatus Woesebacteria bacterium RIFCSPHIGHO2_01_FULL_44_21]|uniref:Glycosyltransferase RgtA/B/C/D-like domain-containing protein n=1 Tax=Candidatus Woesebacteria bacterium RIFCSPHIGHO2_01_FULL_44_21 TaxID=1802503 RepID=A0A1F7YVD0_9BACT|nr:MAG: hypothetical protein A2803_03765 [Candidatus Woesebacteria bacterium RIFCSPHIGHO2_01_FULL_44_21]